MNCPRCGSQMQGGAPHTGGVFQWECRACGKIVCVPRRGFARTLAALVLGSVLAQVTDSVWCGAALLVVIVKWSSAENQ
jgi:hypothetical protein